MTGIERLRAFAGAWDEWGFCGALADIADQIERERDAEVADSPYDAIPPEDRDAIAWVREHGGLDHVKEEWRSRVPYDIYERRRQRLLDHIAECETALGRRRRRIEKLGRTIEFFQLNNSNFRHLLADVAERLGFTRYGDDYEPEDLLDALDRRLMPEGMEWLIEAWPKFEDDAPVKLGDMALIDGDVDMVEAVQIWIHGKPVIYGDNGSQQLEKGERVKRPAVPAADGEPLEAGQTVWDTNGDELVIGAIEDGGHTVTCRYADVGDGIPVYGMWSPSDLTHQRPESWERLEADAGKNPFDYCKDVGHRLDTCENSEAYKARDLVRRARALAERGQ